MNTTPPKINEPSLIRRWKHGWVILWRVLVFNFWLSIFLLPATIVGKLLPKITATYLKPEACGLIIFFIGIINLPLAFCFAASETGFFRKNGEETENI